MASPAPLARPRADTIPVEDLVSWAREGRVRLPDFQRPLRWESGHILALFDSLWRGYPVGNLLFWQRPVAAGAVQFGPFHAEVSGRTDGLLVVDGQQRLTALVGVLLHPAPSRSSSDIHALWFDLEEQRFARPRRGEGAPPHWLPMNKVLDAVELGRWWSANHEIASRDDLHRVALLVGRRIREYRLPVYFVESDDSEPLRVIFGRLNTAGVRMRESEVFTALNLSEGERKPLDRVGAVAREAGMGTVEDAWLLRCVRTVVGEPLDERGSAQPDAYRDHLPKAQVAFGLALDFLRNDCAVPHLRLLPYRLPLVVLTRFFHHHPTPRDRTRMLLRRWFWRGMVSERHKDTQNPHLRWIGKAVSEDELESIDALIQDVGTVDRGRILEVAAQASWSQKTFNAAEAKLHALLLATAQPQMLDGTGPVEVGPLVEQAGPNALLAVRRGRSDRILHPYVEDPMRALDSAPPDVQDSHLWVSSGAGEEARRARLDERFRDALLAWCEPGMPDFGSLGEALADLGEE